MLNRGLHLIYNMVRTSYMLVFNILKSAIELLEQEKPHPVFFLCSKYSSLSTFIKVYQHCQPDVAHSSKQSSSSDIYVQMTF